MRRPRPGAALLAEAGVDAHEVLREVERRRAELARADLAQQALAGRVPLPVGEPRMQPGGAFQDIRSIDCLRCRTTAGRGEGRTQPPPPTGPRRSTPTAARSASRRATASCARPAG